MNKREARAIACYLVGAWAEDVAGFGTVLEEHAVEDAVKIEAEVRQITSRLIDKWYAAGAPEPHRRAE